MTKNQSFRGNVVKALLVYDTFRETYETFLYEARFHFTRSTQSKQNKTVKMIKISGYQKKNGGDSLRS